MLHKAATLLSRVRCSQAGIQQPTEGAQSATGGLHLRRVPERNLSGIFEGLLKPPLLSQKEGYIVL